MILFRALSRFRALFDGDGPSALNRGTTVIWIFSSWFPNLDHVNWFGYLFLHFWVFEVLIVAEESPGDRCDMALHENVNIDHGDKLR